jgi:hypothetical protein
MKRSNFATLLIVLLLSGCGMDEQFIPGQPDENAFISSETNARKAGPVFVVEPTGTDDTDNLLQAFEDAKAAGPWATIQLVEGQYYIGAMDIRDFEGYFTGEGRDKTIISALPDLPCNYMLDVLNVIPALISFTGGDMVISDMTFKMADGFACDDSDGTWKIFYGRDLLAIIIAADYSSLYTPTNRRITSIIQNVDFIGGQDDGSGGLFYPGLNNTAIGVWCGANFWYIDPLPPLTNGDFVIKDCVFDFFVDGAEGSLLGNSSMVVSNNLFVDCTWPLYFTSNAGSDVIIRNNVFENVDWFDIVIDDMDWGIVDFGTITRRMVYEISGNQFSGPTNLILQDMRSIVQDDDFPTLFIVKNNHFTSGEDGIAVSLYNAKDASVRNNRFQGSGLTGILVDGEPGFMSENVLMLGNNFNGATYDMANIWLTGFSKNCTVVGGDNKEIVIDEGIDNIITGMNVNHGNCQVGPSITDNLMIAREMMKRRKMN